MGDNAIRARVSTPWHVWVVGVLFLVLYGIGANDYVQTQVNGESYFESQGYGAVQVDYFTDYPVVPLFFWTVNIVSGLAAVVLLVLRSRWAEPAAATAAISQLILQIITFGFMDRWSILGVRSSVTDIVVMLLTFALWFYCRHLRRANVLT